jgi:shikimate kinase
MRPRNFVTSASELSRPIPKRVYLTGMPGSGKSVVGRQLALLLGYRAVDLDEEVARLAGKSVSALMGEGIDVFRVVERRALEASATEANVVVAAGGGALIESDAREIVLRAGIVAYLRAPVSVLASRLQGRTDRPLLLDEAGSSLDAEALRQRLENLLREREAAYEKSDIVVDVGHQSPAEIAALIARRLGA